VRLSHPGASQTFECPLSRPRTCLGAPLPSLHAPGLAPDVDATLTVGTEALAGAVVGILSP